MHGHPLLLYRNIILQYSKPRRRSQSSILHLFPARQHRVNTLSFPFLRAGSRQRRTVGLSSSLDAPEITSVPGLLCTSSLDTILCPAECSQYWPDQTVFRLDFVRPLRDRGPRKCRLGRRWECFDLAFDERIPCINPAQARSQEVGPKRTASTGERVARSGLLSVYTDPSATALTMPLGVALTGTVFLVGRWRIAPPVSLSTKTKSYCACRLSQNWGSTPNQ